MQTFVKVMFILGIMLLSPVSAVDTFSVKALVSPDEIIEEVPEKFAVNLHPIDGKINLASVMWDPLTENVIGQNGITLRETSVAIVQLHVNDGLLLQHLSSEYEFTILDNLGQGSWVVRMENKAKSSLLSEDPHVRWIGAMQPDWRVSSQVGNSHSLMLSIASDLDATELLEFETKLNLHGDAVCGITQCFVTYWDHVPINLLANDEDVLFIEPAPQMVVMNSDAVNASGITALNSATGWNLDGSGETISIVDTGIDKDHPDLGSRVVQVNTKFGLDPSWADANGGHGTHVAITVAGDGSADSSTKGMAPESYIIFYALEHDSTGVFGRLGSLYDILKNSFENGARINVNAWGLNGNEGKYTSDSRSVDLAVLDSPGLLPVFAVGDAGGLGSNKIAPPATAKNVLSIGSEDSGSVSASSSKGLTLDGRIKPDLVASGVGICSGRAEEAASPAGFSCGSGSHSNGNSLYMELSGSSQATAIAGGAAALTRQYLREEAGISTPSSALIKAVMINGARDLGTADIPNQNEGWGMIDLNSSLNPSEGGNSLDLFIDDGNSVDPGFGLLYSFDIDSSRGIDITLAWTDQAGSANTDQSQSKLINNLDLVLVSPTGQQYLGNDFLNGVTKTGGSADSVNNVERIRIPAGTLSESGQWLIKVMHRGGYTQSFSLVMAADANPTPKADLATHASSIQVSSDSPLVNEAVSIKASWVNQGTLATGQYRVTLTDQTTGQTIFDKTMSSLNPGQSDSETKYWVFETTGEHSLELSIDVDGVVSEMNDELLGTDNNHRTKIVNVAALGVRLIPMTSQGTEPADTSETENATIRTIDPKADSSAQWDLLLRHEGTGIEQVKFYISSVFQKTPGQSFVNQVPKDSWSASSNQSGPFTLQPMDQNGDEISLSLELLNQDVEFDDGQFPRMARAGTYFVDVKAEYQNDNSVSHSLRFKVIVPEVANASIAVAGTSGLKAVPGASSLFSISVMNTGNHPAVYTLTCESQNRWQVMLGSSNSSKMTFESLDVLGYLPMTVRILVPPVQDGNPSAGVEDHVDCWVQSSEDSEFNSSASVTIEVDVLKTFSVDIFDHNGNAVGPSSSGNDIAVDTAQLLNFSVNISNAGNIDLDLSVNVQPADNTWACELYVGDEEGSRTVDVQIPAGTTVSVKLGILVSSVAKQGDSNEFVIKTSYDSQLFNINRTNLVVKDVLELDLTRNLSLPLSADVDGVWSFYEFEIENTGNIELSISWQIGVLPDGWQSSYQNPPSWLAPRDKEVVNIGVIPPANTPPGQSVVDLLVIVTGEAAGQSIIEDLLIPVDVIQTEHGAASIADNSSTPLREIEREGSATQEVVIFNDGNEVLNAVINVSVVDDDGNPVENWKVSTSPNEIEDLAIGQSLTILVKASPNENAKQGLVTVRVEVVPTDGEVMTLDITASVSASKSEGGLFGILPAWSVYSLIVAIVLGVIVVGIRLRKGIEIIDKGADLVLPGIHSDSDVSGLRRKEATHMHDDPENMISGSVSSEELAAVMAESMPTLAIPPPMGVPSGRPPSIVPEGKPPQIASPSPPPPTGAHPLPPEGLPEGWNMEQWQHYGEEWLRRMGRI